MSGKFFTQYLVTYKTRFWLIFNSYFCVLKLLHPRNEPLKLNADWFQRLHISKKSKMKE